MMSNETYQAQFRIATDGIEINALVTADGKTDALERLLKAYPETKLMAHFWRIIRQVPSKAGYINAKMGVYHISRSPN